MTRYALLLRGVNVSGANIVKMADFRAFLTGLGLENVETYIQSGNAVFGSALPKGAIHKLVSEAFPARFGFAPKMMIVTGQELAEAIDGNPFTGPAIDPARLHLGFMAEEPAKSALEKIAAKPRDREEYQIAGRVFYLHSPDGVGKSKFFEGLERMLKVPVTFRNWRTVLALGEMVGLLEMAVPLAGKN